MSNTPVEGGFYTCALIQLANISYSLAWSLDFDLSVNTFDEDQGQMQC